MEKTVLLIMIFYRLLYLVVGEDCYKLVDFRYVDFTCDSGCCGTDDFDRHCCETPTDVGRIVGIVIGSLAGVAVIVGISITVYFCVKKQIKNQDRAIHPTVFEGNTVVGYGNQNGSSNVTFPNATYGNAFGGYTSYDNTLGNYSTTAFGSAFGNEAQYPPSTNHGLFGTQTNYGADPYSK